MWRRVPTVAVALSLTLAGCSLLGDSSVRTAEVDGSSNVMIIVEGAADHPLRLQVRPGDIQGNGTISSGISKVPAPTVPGFTPAGPVQDISVRAPLEHPLTLSFAADAPGCANRYM